MAYMKKDLKNKLAPEIKKTLKKYNMKGTLSIRNNTTLVLKIKSGEIDFNLGDRKTLSFTHGTNCSGLAKKFIDEIIYNMNNCSEVSNFDESDSMTDYFNVGWYSIIEIGEFDKPYILTDKI